MANNYVQFSEIVRNLTDEEEAWLRSQLTMVAVHQGAETELDGYYDEVAKDAEWVGPRFLHQDEEFDNDVELQFDYEFSENSEWKRYLWLYSEDGDPRQSARLVRTVLKQLRPNGFWSLTWAEFCDKPRVSEFSGGAIFVTPDAIEFISAYDFLKERAMAFLTAAIAVQGEAQPSDAAEGGNEPL